MDKRKFFFLTTIFAAILSGAFLVRAQTKSATAVPLTATTFTYQGALQTRAEQATGLYDFEFSVFDAVAQGEQIGQTAVLNEVELDEGRFTVSLDFGPLEAAPHYLQVAVRPSHSGELFTTLTPRQLLSPADSPAVAGNVTGVVTHTHSLNPGAFLYDEDSTDIVMNIYYGLRWAANPNERAGFYMSRPADWDGVSPVEVRLTFAVGSGDAGTVNWRLRLNSYSPNSGEWLSNPAPRNADEILLFSSGSSLRIYDQTFTLQPEAFNDEPYWSFFFTRGDGTNGETYGGNLYVMGADVSYGANR